MSTPHDHFAKMVLQQHRSVASGLLRLALPPAVIEQIALSTLRSSSIRYYDEARGPDEFSEAMAVARELDTELEKAMYTAADMLRDEGREEGRAEGLEEGQRSTLRHQLEFKFGSLPADAVDRLQAASPAELSVWTERILSDDSLEELLNTRPGQKD